MDPSSFQVSPQQIQSLGQLLQSHAPIQATLHEEEPDFVIWPEILNSSFTSPELWVSFATYENSYAQLDMEFCQWMGLADPVSGSQDLQSQNPNVNILGSVSLAQLQTVRTYLLSTRAHKASTVLGGSSFLSLCLPQSTHVVWTARESQSATPWVIRSHSQAQAHAAALVLSQGAPVVLMGSLEDMDQLINQLEKILVNQDYQEVLFDKRNPSLGARGLAIQKDPNLKSLTLQAWQDHVAEFGIDDISGPGPQKTHS